MCHCESRDDLIPHRKLYPRSGRDPACPCSYSAHLGTWQGVGTHSGVSGCQRQEKRTHTTYASGQGPGQPWQPGWPAPSLAQPGFPSQLTTEVKRAFDVRSEASRWSLNLSCCSLHMWGGPRCGDKRRESLGFKEPDLALQFPAQNCPLTECMYVGALASRPGGSWRSGRRMLLSLLGS